MRLIDADKLKGQFSETGAYTCKGVREIIDNAPTVEGYEAGWMDGYNHAIDQIFKELNYLLKNHVIEELRKRIKR